MRHEFFLLGTILALSACGAITPAEMRHPSELGSAQRIAIVGIGGGTHGRYSFGAFSGGFERSEQRMTFFNIFAKNYGHSEFVIEGPGISSTIEARCRMRERSIDVGFAEFTPNRMAYRCEFTADGLSIPARFELQEVDGGLGSALMKRERRGEIALAGEVVQIRSEHGLRKSPMRMAPPTGYVFEQHGAPIGALDLNGPPIFFIQPNSSVDRMRVLSVAAVALAVFWDPANSALE